MVMTKVSRSMDAMGVLSLFEDKRDLKAVITTILSSSSDMFLLKGDVAQCLVLSRRTNGNFI